MPSAESVSLVRQLLNSELRLLPGKNANRVAPAHIFNKFLLRLIGERGAAHQNLRSLVTGGLDPEILERIAESSSEPAVRDDLMRSVGAIFNADRRAFRGMASFLPLSGSVIGDDPSDDNYGAALIEFLTDAQKEELRTDFARALNSEMSSDPISSAISLVTEALSDVSAPRPSSSEDQGETSRENASMFGAVVFNLLRDGLSVDSFKPASPYRLKNIQHVSTMLAGLTALGLLVDPITRAESARDDRSTENLTIGKTLGILVYTGTPPGPARDVCVRLAHASLTDAVQRSYGSIERSFTLMMGGDVWGGDRGWVESVVTASGMSGNNAVKLLRAIEPHMGSGTPSEAFRSLVRPEDLRSSVRSLAVKIGLAGPQRGTGDVRLLLETTFLESLVFFVGEDGMPFETFVNDCYRRLGLVLGRVDEIDDVVTERFKRLAGRSIDISEVLESLHSMLRRRMVASGLAQEYSDGFTVIRRA